jgi:hypothetical protein
MTWDFLLACKHPYSLHTLAPRDAGEQLGIDNNGGHYSSQNFGICFKVRMVSNEKEECRLQTLLVDCVLLQRAWLAQQAARGPGMS